MSMLMFEALQLYALNKLDKENLGLCLEINKVTNHTVNSNVIFYN